MKIAITGATGMIGSALTDSLRGDGHEVLAISRQDGEGRLKWDIDNGEIELDKLEGCDAIVNLAGSSIAQRWSRTVKQEILESRVKGTRLISEAATKLSQKPRVLISASAIGYYGPQPGTPVDESAQVGSGFLASVCQEWEAATHIAEQAGIRVVHVRIGVVLSTQGGALAKMLPPFKAGLGGPVGSGKQIVSWIALEDLVGVFRYCLEHPDIKTPVNATAPRPVSNAEFAQALGDVLGKPTVLPAPAFALKLAMGEMVEETVLADQTVLPKRLEEVGFLFRHSELSTALEKLLK